MLEIIRLSGMQSVQVTNISDPLLLEMLGERTLSGAQKLALMRLLSMNRRYGEEEGARLIEDLNNLIPETSLRLANLDEDEDSRGNKREFVVREADLATSPSFNENYALNELNKLKRRAVKEKVLEPRFNDIQLTFHDVPKDLTKGFMNAREFTGEELYKRLAKLYYRTDRLKAKVFKPGTQVQKDYLEFRARFPEPTKTGEPEHRGRKTVSSPMEEGNSLPGMLTPRTARAAGMKDLEVPSPFTRKTPGKALFLPPSEQEEDILNPAENKRRKGEFPFGAGPSGSMAYDLAVYLFYLTEWKKVDAYTCEEKLLMFGVSRAIAYVKYGHHSFFEALIPLYDYVDKRVFETPEKLYAFITPFIELGLRGGDNFHTEQAQHTDKTPRTQFTVHWDSWASDWTDWRSYKPNNYKPWTITRSKNGPVGLRGEKISPGKYIYVLLAMDKSFRYLPTAPDGEQYRSHSQLAGGLSVFAAGYFQVEEGDRVAWINNSSGHYKPGTQSVEYAAHRLTKLGFDTSATELKEFEPTEADGQWRAWGQQQTMVHLRIAKGWVWPTTGRTRSFPTPPQELLKDMPY